NADRSGDSGQRSSKRTTLADALHQAGRREGEKGAEGQFREAERMQAEWQPEYPWLYSLWGFRFCDLLLDPAERAAWARTLAVPAPVTPPDEAGPLAAIAAVRQRAEQTLDWG